MGLAIGVGMLAEFSGEDRNAAARMRADFKYINQVLAHQGLAAHHEPEIFQEPLRSRASLTSFPYSWLHYLRRFAAHVMRDPKWVPYPIEPGEDPADDPVLHQMYRQMSSHLLCHSDSEGYYIPQDFEEPIFDPDHELRGGVLGSSIRLQEELLLLADALEIGVGDDGRLDDDRALGVAAQRPTGAPYAVERLVWLALFEAARLSIAHQTAVVFY